MNGGGGGDPREVSIIQVPKKCAVHVCASMCNVYTGIYEFCEGCVLFILVFTCFLAPFFGLNTNTVTVFFFYFGQTTTSSRPSTASGPKVSKTVACGLPRCL